MNGAKLKLVEKFKYLENAFTRGGVEDTWLEAKVKNQGRKCKCSKQKKKIFKTIFEAISKENKKKVFKNFFQAITEEKGLEKFFQPICKILAIQKIVLPRAEYTAIYEDLLRTSKCVREDVLEAKDVFEDSTSGIHN